MTNVFDMFDPANWPARHAHAGHRMTTDHAASSYGQAVLVGPDGTAYGAGDLLPCGCTGDWVRRRIAPRMYVLSFETVDGMDRERRMLSADEAAVLDEPGLVDFEPVDED